jgi:hypothetical protein
MELTNSHHYLVETVKTLPCFKNVRMLSTEYRANKKSQVTQVIFTDCLRALDAKDSSQNRNILLFIDRYAAYPQDT